MKIKEVYEFLDSVAPYDTQCSWDNSGLMTGSLEKEVDSVMLCLDCTNDVIEQAVANGCKLIVCHHPLIFSGVKCVCEDSPLYNAVKNGITVISAHTNLDMADGGVNDILCEKLGMENTEYLYAEGAPFMRMGDVDFENAAEFAGHCAEKLGNAVRVCDSGRKVSRVAVCGGSGGEYIYEVAAAGCDTFVTGEAKHHQYLDAQRLGVNMIVAGHFSTEVPVIQSLCDKLLKAFPKHAVFVASEKCPYETVV